MKRSVGAAVTTALIFAIVLAVAAWGMDGSGARPKDGSQGGRVITVIEHATTDATTDTGAPGDSAGDVLMFANELFDARDQAKVGSDQGYCIRTVAATSYECNWTTLLPDGQITVEGPFYDTKDSTLAITGGTGRSPRARQHGTEVARERRQVRIRVPRHLLIDRAGLARDAGGAFRRHRPAVSYTRSASARASSTRMRHRAPRAATSHAERVARRNVTFSSRHGTRIVAALRPR